jgi:4-amino-4-deoxy-L-arabinose transferase-like glycosyltransferase
MVLIVTIAAFLQYIGMANRFIIFGGGDNAEYILLAQSLAKGEGYTNFYVYPLGPHVKYPPFFPLMLAVIFVLFGEKIILVKIMISCCAAVMVGTTALIWKDRGDGFIAFLCAVLVATVPATLLFSTRILSDIPFTAFACLTIFLGDRALKKGSPKSPEFILCIAFLTMAYFTRTAGITLVPAVVCAVFFNRPLRGRLKQKFILVTTMILPFLVVAGAWYLRGIIARGEKATRYLQEFIAKDVSRADSSSIAFTDILERVWINGNYYLKYLTLNLWPFSSNTDDDKKLVLLGLIVLLLAGTGWVRTVHSRLGVPEFFAIFYVALIMLWPFQDDRFLIPLYPVLMYYVLKGIEGIAEADAYLVSPDSRQIVSIIVLLALIACMLGSNIATNMVFFDNAKKMRAFRGVKITDSLSVMAHSRSSVHTLLQALYLRENSEQGVRVLARKPRLVALVSKRVTAGRPFERETEKFIADLDKRKINYVLMDDLTPEVRLSLLPAVKAYPEKFRMVNRIPKTYSMLFKYLPRTPNPDSALSGQD